MIITAIQRYLYVLVLMLPFEIRDLQYDSLKLSTVPQKIGVKGTKLMGMILLVVFFLLEFFKDETHQIKIIVLLILSILTAVFLLWSSKKQSIYYASFWVEALPVFWLVLMLFLTNVTVLLKLFLNLFSCLLYTLDLSILVQSLQYV